PPLVAGQRDREESPAQGVRAERQRRSAWPHRRPLGSVRAGGRGALIRYLLLRLLVAVPTVAGVALIVFSLIHLFPGAPRDVMLGEHASPVDRAALRHSLALDLPLTAQLGKFSSGLVRGDLGRSLITDEPVTKLLAERYPATIELTAAAATIALPIALLLG